MSPTKNSGNDSSLPEQLFGRIDERVKFLLEQKKEIDIQIEKTSNLLHSFLNRLVALESKDFKAVQEELHLIKAELVELRSKVQNLEIKAESAQISIGRNEYRWTQIFDAIWKVSLMCIAGYILYKLGLQSPPGS